MPGRRRIQARHSQQVNPLDAFAWSAKGDGLDHMLGGTCFRTRREAERAWQRARVRVWAAAPIGRVPQSAMVFDGLTEDGLRRLWTAWNHLLFPSGEVLDALAADRARLATFSATTAGATLADFLAALSGAWETVATTATQFAATPSLARSWPSGVVPGAYYGSLRARE